MSDTDNLWLQYVLSCSHDYVHLLCWSITIKIGNAIIQNVNFNSCLLTQSVLGHDLQVMRSVLWSCPESTGIVHDTVHGSASCHRHCIWLEIDGMGSCGLRVVLMGTFIMGLASMGPCEVSHCKHLRCKMCYIQLCEHSPVNDRHMLL